MKRKQSEGIPEQQPTKTTFNLRQTRQELEQNGFSQIPVLTPGQTAYYHSKAWKWLSKFNTGADRYQPKTLKAYNMPPGTHGLVQHFRVGHAKFFWKLRTEQVLMEVFANLWSCKVDDLLVSFDGMNFGIPSTRVQKEWPHLDQTLKSEHPLYYQGCVSLTQTDGGLNFYSGSHKLHGEFCDMVKRFKKPGFYQLSQEDQDWYLKKRSLSKEFVPSTPGMLTVWDSRTVHWGRRPVNYGESGLDPVRICMYVCYIPRDHILRTLSPLSDEVKSKMKIDKYLEKRRRTFEERRMTTHQPYPVKLFSKQVRPYGKDELKYTFHDQPVISDEDLTHEMRRLIGYDE